MKQIPLTRGRFIIVDDEDYDRLSSVAWHLNKGYARNDTLGYMHRVVLKQKPRQGTDHINGDKLDNRRENLRPATSQQNNLNRGKSIRNKSGFKGVSWSRTSRKWLACVYINGKQTYLGLYQDKRAAHSVYWKAAQELHGEFAHP